MATIVSPGERARVTVLPVTLDPIKVVAAAQKNMRGEMVHDLSLISDTEAEELFLDVCKTELAGALEFVHFVIQFDGFTRAFQQQLTRTRLASYSAESLRFTESGMEVLAGPHLVEVDRQWHADNDRAIDYGLSVKTGLCPMDVYKTTMDAVEGTYGTLIAAGVPTEDARGVLPLNVLSKIGMCVSYKTLVSMSRVRMCYQSQEGEWGFAFAQIAQQLEAIHPLLVHPLGAFCDAGISCPFGSILDRKCERR